MNIRHVSAGIALCAFAGASIGASAATVHPATGARASRSAPIAFDLRLYESYARAHHHALISYRDNRGKITPFALAWMQHRKVCGGAVTEMQMNPTTLSSIQEWQGCSATRKIGQTAIHFQAESWMK